MWSGASVAYFTTVQEDLGSIPTQDYIFRKFLSPFFLIMDCKAYYCNIIVTDNIRFPLIQINLEFIYKYCRKNNPKYFPQPLVHKVSAKVVQSKKLLEQTLTLMRVDFQNLKNIKTYLKTISNNVIDLIHTVYSCKLDNVNC